MAERLRNTAFWSLVALAGVQAASAISGGVGLMATAGLGMPSSFLATGPFSNFIGPGVILLVVVGGTQVIAMGLLLARREAGLFWSAVAGFGMILWIYVETGMIRGTSWLQVLYLATGIAQLILVMALLGVAAWLPRAPLPASRSSQDRR